MDIILRQQMFATLATVGALLAQGQGRQDAARAIRDTRRSSTTALPALWLTVQPARPRVVSPAPVQPPTPAPHARLAIISRTQVLPHPPARPVQPDAPRAPALPPAVAAVLAIMRVQALVLPQVSLIALLQPAPPLALPARMATGGQEALLIPAVALPLVLPTVIHAQLLPYVPPATLAIIRCALLVLQTALLTHLLQHAQLVLLTLLLLAHPVPIPRV